MKAKLTKVLSLVLVVIMALSLMTGCSTSSSGKGTKTQTEEKNDRSQRRLDRDSRPVCSPDRSPDSDQHSHRSALRGPLCGTA